MNSKEKIYQLKNVISKGDKVSINETIIKDGITLIKKGEFYKFLGFKDEIYKIEEKELILSYIKIETNPESNVLTFMPSNDFIWTYLLNVKQVLRKK